MEEGRRFIMMEIKKEMKNTRTEPGNEHLVRIGRCDRESSVMTYDHTLLVCTYLYTDDG